MGHCTSCSRRGRHQITTRRADSGRPSRVQCAGESLIYDEPSRKLKTRELARLAFRRTMALGMVATIAGGLAGAIGARDLATRSHAPCLLVLPILIVLPVGAVFYLRWRSPPASAVERFTRDIRSKRKAGDTAAALSRTFVAMVGGRLTRAMFSQRVTRGIVHGGSLHRALSVTRHEVPNLGARTSSMSASIPPSGASCANRRIRTKRHRSDPPGSS